MPPLPLLVALMMAFGIGEQFPGEVGAREEVGAKLLDAAASIFLAASTSLGIGLGLATSLRRSGGGHPASLQVYSILSSAIAVMNLGVYAWILFGLGWVAVVRDGLGLRNWFFVDELLIILPYVIAEVASWFGLLPASRALSSRLSRMGVLPYLILRLRATFGLVLPAILVFAILKELIDRSVGPDLAKTWWVDLFKMAVLGLMLATASPLLVRLAFPTRPLRAGPLRDQLMRQARRLRFRLTDILVWDTNGQIANALLSGLLPGLRYVVLSDGMIDNLHPCKIAGMFGHEICHARRLHFLMFGLFVAGSFPLLSLAFHPLELYLEPFLKRYWPETAVLGVVYGIQTCLMLTYVYVVFGGLSRMLERQADVFGCRSISCDGPICPPHGEPDVDEFAGVEAPFVCPVGVRLYVDGLAEVGSLNRIDLRKFEWRHGSIAGRIRFLETLVDDPSAEARFEREVRLKLVLLACATGLAFVASVLTGSIEQIAKP